MIRQIAPQFFTADMATTLAYYREQLGFTCEGTYLDPPVYAIVVRDGQHIHFRLAPAPAVFAEKYDDELLDVHGMGPALVRKHGAALLAILRG